MKLTRQLLESMILEALPDPAQGLNNATSTTIKPVKKTTATTMSKPSEDPTKQIVDKKRYIDLQNKTNELNNKLNTMPATDLISKFREFLSEVASL